jgi:hypothetical protein
MKLEIPNTIIESTGLLLAAGGQMNFSLDGTATGLTLTIKSSGTRTSADVKLDASMLRFISQSLLKPNGAKLELCQADETGAHIRFSFLQP